MHSGKTIDIDPESDRQERAKVLISRMYKRSGEGVGELLTRCK